MRPPTWVYIAVVATAFGLATAVTFAVDRNNDTLAGLLDAVFVVLGVGGLELWAWRRRREQRALAAATMTFLFADLEGSTRLLERLGEAYGELLGRIEGIVERAGSEHRGEVVDAQGDAFFVVFGSAGGAVRAALQIHRGLAEEAWPFGAAPRVRVGIHTGTASRRGERVLGMAVHRAARICGAAHGGQTLLSATTYGLLVDERDALAGVQILDLGEPPLKDLDRPLRVYQATEQGGLDRFPPLRTAQASAPFAGDEDRLAGALSERRTDRS